MDLVQRAKNIVLTPNTEWGVIETEPATTGGLITGYAVPLAAIGAVGRLHRQRADRNDAAVCRALPHADHGGAGRRASSPSAWRWSASSCCR